MPDALDVLDDLPLIDLPLPARIAAPTSERDWYTVPWDEVFARTGIAPRVLPGVRTAADHPVAQLAPRTATEFAKQAGASARPPYPYRVHRSHLPVLGYDAQCPPVAPIAIGILRPHQIDGARFIRERRGSLLAFEMRCGKTPTIVYSHEPERGPLVVVGPTEARAVWHEWAARRFGACQVFYEKGFVCSVCERVDAAAPDTIPSFASLAGKTPDLDLIREGARVLYLTFAAVVPWSDCFAAFGKIGTLVVDEAHRAGVQDRRNETPLAIRRLAVMAHRVVASTGTPMWNMPSGLWTILDTICPTAFGDYWPYAIRYCRARPTEHGWVADGQSNERELELRLSAVMLRRTWNEIQGHLPPINRAVEYVELSDEEHAAVYETAAELRRTLGRGRPQTVVGNLERLRKLYAGRKVARAAEVIEATLADGHSVVAWTWHQDVARALSEALGTSPAVYGPIHQGTPQAAREQILEELRFDPRPRVLIASMGTMATAVSLSWASHEIMVELEWTPAVHQQAEMRCFDGSRPISVTYLVADCDPDRRLCDALLTKLDAAAALGLRAGTGDVAEVLASAFGVEAGKGLDAVASAILAAESL